MAYNVKSQVDGIDVTFGTPGEAKEARALFLMAGYKPEELGLTGKKESMDAEAGATTLQIKGITPEKFGVELERMQKLEKRFRDYTEGEGITVSPLTIRFNDRNENNPISPTFEARSILTFTDPETLADKLDKYDIRINNFYRNKCIAYLDIVPKESNFFKLEEMFNDPTRKFPPKTRNAPGR